MDKEEKDKYKRNQTSLFIYESYKYSSAVNFCSEVGNRLNKWYGYAIQASRVKYHNKIILFKLKLCKDKIKENEKTNQRTQAFVKFPNKGYFTKMIENTIKKVS